MNIKEMEENGTIDYYLDLKMLQTQGFHSYVCL